MQRLQRHQVDAAPIPGYKFQAIHAVQLFLASRLRLLPSLPRLIVGGNHRWQSDQEPGEGCEKSSQRRDVNPELQHDFFSLLVNLNPDKSPGFSRVCRPRRDTALLCQFTPGLRTLKSKAPACVIK